MATAPRTSGLQLNIPARIHTPRDFVQTLMKLQRWAQLITSTLDLEAFFDRIVDDLAVSIGSVEVSVWLRDPESGDMVLHGGRGCTTHKKGARLKAGEGMLGYVAKTGQMRYAPDVLLDSYYTPCKSATRSALDIPLKVGEEVIGVLCIDHPEPNAFSPDQLQVLQALAGHITVAIGNAQLFHREREARDRMHREAEEARAIQQALFPKMYPLLPGFAFETSWQPAGAVAGDWFDFIDLGDQRCGVVLGDVSGKGMPAALLMSATRAILRTLAKLHLAPGQTLLYLNQALLEDLPDSKFVTAIYGVLDARSREFTFASAGHPRPLLINGECSFLQVDSGFPLGLAPSLYPERTVKLEPGSKVLLYSDGITEAMDAHDEEYGPARLVEYFLRPEACVDGLVAEVQRFGQRSDCIDDATAVLIRTR